MKRTFEYNDEKSSKFWTIETNNSEFAVTFGKTGTTGQSQTKTFADEETCLDEAEKLIREKIKKGYVEQGETSKTETPKTAPANEQKYVPEWEAAFEEIMSTMRWESDKYEEVESFIEYYEEYCTNSYALVSDQSITFVWNDPDNAPRQPMCTITPATKTAMLQPTKGKAVKAKISDELLEQVENEVKNWKLTVSPFKSKPKKSISTKSLKIPMVLIKGKPNAKPITMPDNLFICCANKKRGSQWTISANGHDKKMIYANNTYKKRFATLEEAVIDLIKVAIEVSNLPGFEVIYLCDFNNHDKKYLIEDMEQLVYQYIKKQSLSVATELELPIYDPSEDKQNKDFITAIKIGNTTLVKQFLMAGASPEKVEIKQSRINPFQIALEAKQPEVASALIEHGKALGDDIPKWMIDAVLKISKPTE